MEVLFVSDNACFHPITHPQQRIWYIEKFYRNTSIGNIAGTIKIKECIDFQLFQESINRMIEKNDGLRLHFVEEDGHVKQYVSAFKYTDIECLDFTELTEQEILEWGDRQTAIPFALEDSDLFYFALIRINDHESCMYLKLHHLITDAWSIVMLTNQIIEYYAALRNGKEIDVDFPSYTEFIASEQEYLNSKRYLADREYWNKKFDSVPEIVSFKSREKGFSMADARRESVTVPEAFASRMRKYCQENKTSIFSLFLSILAIYVFRISDNDDIVIGTPVLNRSNRREKEMAGMFVSTVPIRIKLNDNLSFKEFEGSIMADWMSTLRHQRYPFELLLKDLRKKYRNLDSLYNILLSYQNGRFDRDIDIDFEGTWHSNGYQADPLFIHINDREGDGCLVIDYDYMIQFFNSDDIIFLHRRLMRLFEDAITNPDKLISQLDYIDEEERRTILEGFNNTARYVLKKPVHQLFEEQAARTPDNTALVFNGSQLTYRQLNERSNQLARLLRQAGIKPGCVAGILTHRSLDMIIGIMAILKAGGCYLPIDPDYPPERMEYMLEDSKADVLLTNKVLASDIKYSGKVIDLKDECISSMDSGNLENANTPGDLAYVMYTSGSTGKPKAVMIEHGALANYIDAIEQWMDYTPGRTVLSVTTMAFDIFVYEIFPSLAKGLRIVLANEQQQKIPEDLSELIIREGVEKILTTPSRMQFLVFGQSDHKCFDVLKEIALGGEPFPQRLLEGLKKLTKAKILNLYGPTEATVYSTIKDLTDTDVITIGRPLSNYKVYIVDRFSNLAPIGVQGEICIGGDSIGRGYLHKPDLTAEKFVPNPFEPGSMMYRTGDLGRWNQDGEIEFAGRMDYQVKIRGYRIELGEIENQLLNNSLIKEAVVVDREDDTGKKYLCAYYVSDSAVSYSELRDMLARKLPAYMIPASFTRLDKIPLTPNGKTDRRALPEPVIISTEEREYSGPRNETDERLIAIWSKVMKLNDIGIDDNFFEIGGDSLTILEIQIEMLKYKWSLNTQEFYKYNTIRGLSDRIAGIGVSEQATAVEEIAATSFVVNNNEPVIAHHGGFRYKNVLLTGATGFLGIHILKELLSSTDANVCCIVRGQTDNNAGERLIRLIEFYFPDDYRRLDFSRLSIYRGDVSKDMFGLNEKVYRSIGEKADLVIHTAAIVKYYGDYEDFRKTNVVGTRNAAAFCMEFGKPLAHISTLGVSGNYLVAQEYPQLKFTENDFYVGQRFMDNVYIRSKYEAESLIYQRMQDGLAACVFRIGNLTGRYSDGHFQQNADENAFYNILRSLIKLGAINNDVLERGIEFTPVDCCSKAILTLLNVKNFPRRVYHVFNHNLITMKRMLEIFETFDIHINAMENHEFSRFIDKMVQDDYKNKYLVGIVNDLGRNRSLDFSTLINIDSEITNEALKQLGFVWPEVNEAYIGRIVRYMRVSEYLG